MMSNERESRLSRASTGLSELQETRSIPEQVSESFERSVVATRVPVPETEDIEQGQASATEKSSQTSNGSAAHKQAPGRPMQHGFFSKSLRQKRIEVLKKLAISVLIMAVLMLGLLSIYWGSFYKRTEYYKRVKFWIINLDDSGDAVVGPSFVSVAQTFANQQGAFGVEVRDPQQYGSDYSTICNEIVHERSWGVFFIRSNASSNLANLLENPESYGTYDSKSAITFVYAQARDQSLYAAVLSWVTELAIVFQGDFSAQTISNAAVNYSLTSIINANASILATPVAIGYDNIRPFGDPIAIAPTQVGLLYLIILSFFQFNFFQPVHLSIAQDLKRSHYLIYRILSTWIAYFLLSLFYSLISLAFQIDFTKSFGRAGFFIFWMMNWLCMIAVGGACENLALFSFSTYPPITGFCLIFMVISNVSVSFFPIQLMNNFYRYGYAFPIKNLVDSTKTIMFDTHNVMGRNVGVLCAWVALDVLLLPFVITFFARQMQKNRMKQAAIEQAKKAAETNAAEK